MRYAIISDIHNQFEHLQQVMNHIASMYVQDLICLGDIFEAKIGKKALPSYVYTHIEDVVDINYQIIEMLASSKWVIGNQEERLAAIIPPYDMPEAISTILKGPTDLYLKHAHLTHGHLYNWNDPHSDIRYPIVDVFDRPLIIYGHSHKNKLLKVNGDPSLQASYQQLTIVYEQAILLDKESHYLINIGAVQSSHPKWLLYDEAAHSITYFKL